MVLQKLLKVSNEEDEPVVSVIMNCYNGEKYIKDSIQSVLNQDYRN